MIVKKILKVMEQIGPIIKDKTNEDKNFDYASIAMIIFKAREAMIEEKIIMFPLKIDQITARGNDVIIGMTYRFYDTEPNDKGQCDYLDVNIPGEGCDKEGWAIYKALSGCYKYAITQTFAIPTIDDAEKSKFTSESNENDNPEEQTITEAGALNVSKIEEILGNPNESDFEAIFDLSKSVG